MNPLNYPEDLYAVTQITQNSGLTPEQVRMWENMALIRLFGQKSGEELINYLDANTVCGFSTPTVTPDFDNPLGGSVTEKIRTCTYGNLTEFVLGAGAFVGLKKILAFYVGMCANSLGNTLINRANSSESYRGQGNYIQSMQLRVNNTLALQLNNATVQMQIYLRKDGKNPLNLAVFGVMRPMAAVENTSGKKPAFFTNYRIY